MRTIKFKAKCQQTGDWVEGDLIHGVGHKAENVYILPNTVNLAYVKHCDPLDGVQVDPETVCQFTGLLDKNGVEICEGDTFGNDSFQYEVVFVDGAFKLNHLSHPSLGIWGPLSALFESKMAELNELTVLTGNIHDK